MSLSRGLATVALEVIGILAATGVATRVVRRRARGPRPRLAQVSPAVIGALAVVLVFVALADALSQLDAQRRMPVGAQGAVEHCATEVGAGVRLPLVRWLAARLPGRARYAIYSPGLPDLCLALVLLPRLPVAPGVGAPWLITIGAIPPDVQARIARADPTVQVFSPGFVLAREAAR